MSRRTGEITRLRHQIAILYAHATSLEMSLDANIPLTELATVLSSCATNIVANAARVDAYMFAERDESEITKARDELGMMATEYIQGLQENLDGISKIATGDAARSTLLTDRESIAELLAVGKKGTP